MPIGRLISVVFRGLHLHLNRNNEKGGKLTLFHRVGNYCLGGRELVNGPLLYELLSYVPLQLDKEWTWGIRY